MLEVRLNESSGRYRLAPRAAFAENGLQSNVIPSFARQDLTVRLPANLFHPGLNVIGISFVNGTGGICESAVLSQVDKAFPACEWQPSVEPSYLWEKRNDRLHEIVNLIVRNAGQNGPVHYRLLLQDQRFTGTLPPGQTHGDAVIPLLVRDPGGAVEASLELASSECSQTYRLRYVPSPKYDVYIAPATHLDIGYTDPQPDAVEGHLRNTDAALDIIDRNRNFKWNVEGTWEVEQYLRQRNENRRSAFLQKAAEGRIGISAVHSHVQSYLCSVEELLQATSFSHQLGQNQGIAADAAMFSDVPSLTWSLPSVLAHAGVRYLAAGANQARGPMLLYGGLDTLGPFYWEGPDGKRVLVWYTKNYAQARVLFGIPASFQQAGNTLRSFFRGFSSDYPFHSVLVYGHDGDNARLTGDGNTAFYEEWNSRYAYPRLIPSTIRDFFQACEREGTNRAPVFRGDGGAYWEDGAGQCPRALALNRSNQARAVEVEKLASLATLWRPDLAYPSERLREVWNNILLFDEHTFGSSGASLSPDSLETQLQYRIKAGFASSADADLRYLLQEWLHKATSAISQTSDSVVVWNLENWARSGAVETDLPANSSLLEGPGGAPVPLEILSENAAYRSVRFLARDVPALGFRCYAVAHHRQPVDANDNEGVADTIENEFYRIGFDARRGGISSIYDKQLRTELVDVSHPFVLAQFVYSAETAHPRSVTAAWWSSGARTLLDVNDFNLPKPVLHLQGADLNGRVEIQHTPTGPTAILHSSGISAPRIETIVRLHPGVKRIDLVVRMDKARPRMETAEAVYIAFPFAVDAPRFTCQLATGFVDPEHDMLPGGCTEWFAVDGTVSVDNAGACVTLATPDAPLVTLGDVVRGKWPRSFDKPQRGSLYSYVMNNYWLTNFPAGQEEGVFVFRYSIGTSRRRDLAAIRRLGEEARHPLLAANLRASRPLAGTGAKTEGDVDERTVPPVSISVEADSVNLVTLRSAKAPSTLLLRLLETSGRSADAIVSMRDFRVRRAFLASAHEDRERELPVEDGAVALHLGPHSLCTVLVDYGR